MSKRLSSFFKASEFRNELPEKFSSILRFSFHHLDFAQPTSVCICRKANKYKLKSDQGFYFYT
jgi:hypothetical protein